jgi:hypothetical protein
MPDWSMMKKQTKKQSSRFSRIAGSWTQGWQPAPEYNTVEKSKEAKAGLSKMWRLTKRSKDLSWGRRTGGMLPGIRTAGAEASEEGHGSKWALVPMVMMQVWLFSICHSITYLLEGVTVNTHRVFYIFVTSERRTWRSEWEIEPGSSVGNCIYLGEMRNMY